MREVENIVEFDCFYLVLSEGKRVIVIIIEQGSILAKISAISRDKCYVDAMGVCSPRWCVSGGVEENARTNTTSHDARCFRVSYTGMRVLVRFFLKSLSRIASRHVMSLQSVVLCGNTQLLWLLLMLLLEHSMK